MKAILVIDVPESCEKCDLGLQYGSICCVIGNTYIPNGKKSCECPLKPLPNKIDLGYPCEKYDEGYSDGWDECIDEILGEEK